MCACVHVGVYILLHMEGGQKTAYRNCFSPSRGSQRLISGGPSFPQMPTVSFGSDSSLFVCFVWMTHLLVSVGY